ncbi:MAG TPA: hypothetical protein VF984_03890, partial [Actinomycetota bacterium]
DGYLETTASRGLGDVGIGGFPGNVKAPGAFLGYLLRLDGYSDRAQASSGTSAPAPSTSVDGGTIWYWDAAANGGNGGYVQLSATDGGTLPAMVASVPDPLLGTVTATLTPLEGVSVAAVRRTNGAGTAGQANPGANSATASVQAPLAGQYEYSVSLNGTIVLDVTITVDLGTVAARSSYSPAPGASPSPSP